MSFLLLLIPVAIWLDWQRNVRIFNLLKKVTF